MTPSLHTVTSGVEGGLSFILYLFTYELPDFISFLIKELLVSFKSSIMRFVVLFVLVFTTSFAWTGSGSKPSPSSDESVGFIPIEVATRAIIFSESHYSTARDGSILICLAGKMRLEIAGPSSYCGEKNNLWVDMNNYSVPGYRLVGFKFASASYNTNLILFFNK